MMKVLVKEVGQDPVMKEIANDLDVLQKFVGGYIEAVPLGAGVVMICDEEGAIKAGRKLNFKLQGQPIYNNVFFCEVEKGEFVSLAEERLVLLEGLWNTVIKWEEEE